MEQAIKKALDEGYAPQGYCAWLEKYKDSGSYSEIENLNLYSISTFVLDPLFWQALGKAEGWKGKYEYTYHDSFGTGTPFEYPAWLRYWHSFIDHLADGKDIDSFFNNLLTTPSEQEEEK